MACSESSLDKDLHQSGDFLTGTVSYCNADEHQKWSNFGAGKLPGGYSCRVVVGSGSSATKSKSSVSTISSDGPVVTPGELTSRVSLMHEWSIKRLRKEFSGKKGYDAEYDLVKSELESESESEKMSEDECSTLRVMLAQSLLHHTDANQKKCHYLTSPSAADSVAESEVKSGGETKSSGDDKDAAAAAAAAAAVGVVAVENVKIKVEDKKESSLRVVDAADALIALIDGDALVRLVFFCFFFFTI